MSLALDGYSSPPQQFLDNRDKKQHTLQFLLTPIAQHATLVIDSAPAGTEVVIDGASAGNVGAQGSFSKEVLPGSHSILLRADRYLPISQSLDLKANDSTTVSGSGMKAFGTLTFRITPATARITLQRDANARLATLANNSTYALPPGEYAVSAEAGNYVATTDRVIVTSGNTVTVSWALKPIPKLPAAPTPATVFEDGSSWRIDGSGWWVHEGKSYSFLRMHDGVFACQILRGTSKHGIFGTGKKITFVVDYRDEDNRTVYTLDGRYLKKRVYAGTARGGDEKFDVGEGTLTLVIDMSKDLVILKTGNGQLIDTVRRIGTSGRVGFRDQVWLAPR
jgi:hypothetical protein